ncbi:hypothetical protein CMI41_01180 [Candidatus Pacearchaeota archaeon]|nr:hypothetical protein [Candidatus Pacearchaeota archaeon]|tara:strand:- start:9076 stop:9696 length:621 start_codon:yes stop_codon:yes gene_type:complete
MSISGSDKRLLAINDMIDKYLNSSNPILTTTTKFLGHLQEIALNLEEEDIELSKNLHKEPITITTKVMRYRVEEELFYTLGMVINFPGQKQENITTARYLKNRDKEECCFDGIYMSLRTLLDLYVGANINTPIHVISDHLEVIEKMNSEKKCDTTLLTKKRDLILKLTTAFEQTSVIFTWKPKDSTSDLVNAKAAAINLMGNALMD